MTPHGIKDVEEPLSTHKEARLQGVLGFQLWIVLFGVDHIKTPGFPKVMGAVHPLLFSGELEESEHLERQLVGSWYMTQGAQPVSVTTWRWGRPGREEGVTQVRRFLVLRFRNQHGIVRQLSSSLRRAFENNIFLSKCKNILQNYGDEGTAVGMKEIIV